jgi:hypothetical protein
MLARSQVALLIVVDGSLPFSDVVLRSWLAQVM